MAHGEKDSLARRSNTGKTLGHSMTDIALTLTEEVYNHYRSIFSHAAHGRSGLCQLPALRSRSRRS